MKTKIIFSALALAMLLATACNKNESAIEESNEKGYTLPVTINVTREGDDATKAMYNASDKKLEFSTGDKLLVNGQDASDGGAGYFAGILDWVSEGTFSGTITTEEAYTGTADALFTAAKSSAYVHAILLPAGYEGYGYLEIFGTGYEACEIINSYYTLATSKAAAVEQFSCEVAYSYSGGFALAPDNAILNFTITGLTASTSVDVSLTGSGYTITKTVTTDSDGKAVFGAGVVDGTDLNNLSLTVGGNAITLVNSSKPLEADHIYNITRSALPPAEGHALSTSVVGEIVGSDGEAYAAVDKGNLPTGVTAVAMVAYKSGSNGLAIALTDETGTMNWTTANSTCVGKTAVGGNSWHLPSQPEWKQMFAANGGDEDSFTGLNAAITTAGGTGITKWRYYWTSSLDGDYPIYIDIQSWVGYDNPDSEGGAENCWVRACLAF